MASFITANETLEQRHNGSISRSFPVIIGRLLDEAAGVHCGRVVAVAGTTNDECQEPTSEALVKTAYGFTVYSPMHEPADLTDGTPHYADNSVVSIMTKGSMYVDCEGTVVAGAPVYVRTTSDGASNTELGKVRGNSDLPSDVLIITPVPVAAVVTTYSLTLSNGTTEETFIFTSDASPSAGEVAAGLVALIDASSAFTAAGTTTISIGSATGIVDIIAIHPQLTVTTPARAHRLPGAYFTESRTGAGLVEINFDRLGGI
jgi:hypothetical protein